MYFVINLLLGYREEEGVPAQAGEGLVQLMYVQHVQYIVYIVSDLSCYREEEGVPAPAGEGVVQPTRWAWLYYYLTITKSLYTLYSMFNILCTLSLSYLWVTGKRKEFLPQQERVWFSLRDGLGFIII